MGHRMTPEFLAAIAAQYNAATAEGRPPAPPIAAAYGVPVATVHRWVSEARKKGVLPPGRRGSAGSKEKPVHVGGGGPLPEAYGPHRQWRVEQQSGDVWDAVGDAISSRTDALVALGVARGSEPDRPPLRIIRLTTTSVVEHTEG